MKPILFNTEMVRAILDGRKTVTRRVMKPQPVHENGFWKVYGAGWSDNVHSVTPVYGHSLYAHAPYKPEDILWVRETFTTAPDTNGKDIFVYKVYDRNRKILEEVNGEIISWSPSIHMPKEAARIFLRVTDVRVELLQDMTEEDAEAEGYDSEPLCAHYVYENYPDSPIPCYAAANPNCPADPPCNHTVPEMFGQDMWNKTIKPSEHYRYDWDANPWVWVIEFERCEKPKED